MSRRFYAQVRADIQRELTEAILGIKKPTQKLILPEGNPCYGCFSTDTIGSSVCRQGDKGKPCRYWIEVIVPGLKSGAIKKERISN